MAFTEEDKEWLSAQLDTINARVDNALKKQMEVVDAKLEHLETALLTAFHQWASPADMRARTHAAAIRTLDMEMEAIDDRVTKLERPPS